MKEVWELLPMTHDYVSSILNRERKGHHVSVIKNNVINTNIPLTEKSEDELKLFDIECLLYLKELDGIEGLLGNIPKAKDLAEYLNVTESAVSQYDKTKKELMLLGLWLKNSL